MKQDIFETVGKRTPYKVPDGFFERSERNIVENVSKRLRSQTLTKTAIVNRKLYWIYGIAAASVVLAIGILGIIRMTMPTVEPTAEPVYAQTYDASDDWSDFADADLFLDNMEW